MTISLNFATLSPMAATLSTRKSKRTNSPTLKAKKLVRNLTSGKFASQRAAAIDAGYSPHTSPSSVLNRPLVKSALTEAMQKIGISYDLLLQPLKDALTATRSYVDEKKGMVESTVPDHKIRLEASRDGVAILGGIPKVGEGTPAAYGLNLFVAVDNGQGKRVEVSAHEVRPGLSSKPPQLAVQIADTSPKNVQAPARPTPLVVHPPLAPLDPNAPDPALND